MPAMTPTPAVAIPETTRDLEAVTTAAQRIFEVMCNGPVDWAKHAADTNEDSLFRSADWECCLAYAKKALASSSAAPSGEAEPVASMPEHAKWCQPGDQQAAQHYLIRFDDPDMPDAVFTDWTKAREFYARSTLSWNCWLFAAVSAEALATPTQPASPIEQGEVERLIERLRATYNEWNNPPSEGLPIGAGILNEAATALAALQAELEVVKERLAIEVKGSHEAYKLYLASEALAAADAASVPAKDDLRDHVLSRIAVFRDTEPEEDESWESWYFAAFDLLHGEISRLPAATAVAVPGMVEGAGRTVAWLIERQDRHVYGYLPHWYAEREDDGWHWWTDDATEAKRFETKAEAEAYPAYQQIASDPTISLTEHVFLAASPSTETDGGREP